MHDEEIHQVIRLLKAEQKRKRWPIPVVGVIAKEAADPFKILIACVLSLRTKDHTTANAAHRLFDLAHTPETLAQVSLDAIQNAIYPVGFYRTKARQILKICRVLQHEYRGVVPASIDELLKLPGVGRKTANLVVTLGYQKPGICVDTHVHRICNRWGYVQTTSPDETEAALREKLPSRYWIGLNELLVSFGQHVCRPVRPLCSACRLDRFCSKKDVFKSK